MKEKSRQDARSCVSWRFRPGPAFDDEGERPRKGQD